MSLTASISSDTVIVEPGTTAPLTIEVENTSQSEDQIEVAVEGIDGEWVVIPVPTLNLKAGESQSLKVFFKPPRQTESTAGNFPFVAKIRSLNTGDQKIAQGILTIKPFHSLSIELNPKKGFISATKNQNIFTATLMNLGNSEHKVQLFADDPEDSCTFEFDDEVLPLGPGHQREVDFMVTPKRRSPFGSARLIGFVVTGRSTDVPGVVTSSQAQLEVRPLLTPASAIIAAVFIIVGFFLWITQPKPPAVRLELIGPKQVKVGQEILIHWTAENASAVKLVAGGTVIGENLPAEGTKSVTATEIGTLRIQAVAFRDNRESPTFSAQVDVIEAPIIPEPKILELVPSTVNVNKGEKFTLKYKFNPAVVKAKISPQNVELDLNVNTLIVEPYQMGENEFTIIAENAEGKVIKKAFKVQQVEPVLAKIIKFEVTPLEVTPENSTVKLSWQIDSASRIEFSYTGSDVFTLEPSGTTEVPINAKTTFTIKAYDSNGKSISKSITVKYNKPTDPTNQNSVQPNDPDVGQPSTTGSTTGTTNG
jgi:hypothetical protein